MKMLLMLFAMTALSAQGQFYVPDQEYRCPPGDGACVSPHNLSSFQKITTQAGGSFTLNFIEHKDSGELWNPIELSDAKRRVKEAINNDENALIVVYIHGWENNADEIPRDCSKHDVCKFRDQLLTRLADSQEEIRKRGGKPLEIVGIYLAWRGESFTKEPFKHFFSYWPRRNVAHRIGQTGMYKTINEIEATIRPARQRYVVVFVGHSFGARVLENAAETQDRHHTGFMLAYRSQIKQLAAKRQASLTSQTEEMHALNQGLPADLIFYVNAATSSTVTRETIKDFQKTCKIEPNAPICISNPEYLSVTSHADAATGIIMPIANAVLPAFSSDHLRLISAANTPSLRTHHDPTPNCGAHAALCFITKSGNTVQVESIAGKLEIPGSTRLPFWIFNVSSDVMNSHGDIWNSSVSDLVTHVIVGNKRYRSLTR
jgi:hypothetical protein